MPQGHTPLGVTHFWCVLCGALFSGCRKREMLHVAAKKVNIYLAKIGFVDSRWSNLNAPGSYTPWCRASKEYGSFQNSNLEYSFIVIFKFRIYSNMGSWELQNKLFRSKIHSKLTEKWNFLMVVQPLSMSQNQGYGLNQNGGQTTSILLPLLVKSSSSLLFAWCPPVDIVPEPVKPCLSSDESCRKQPDRRPLPLSPSRSAPRKRRQNSSGSYSDSRMLGLTSSYSKFEFSEYSLDALPWCN